MPETNVVEAPVIPSQVPAQVPITPILAPVETPVPAKEPDLITKVSQFKQSQIKAKENIINAPEQPEFEAIKDPIAKEAAKQAVERMRRGMQSLYDQKVEDAKKINWTAERLHQEVNNPQFIQVAKDYAAIQNPPNSGLTDQQYSALNDIEKAEISGLKSQVNSLQQTNFLATVAQRDSQLQMRYPDYNPMQINETIQNLARMNPLDIREHVYKSLKHDEDVAAAYELGKSERIELNQTKINAITPNGNSVSTSDSLPIREKDESNQEYFQKLANFRLAQFKNRK